MPFKRYVDPSYMLLSGEAFPGTISGQAYARLNVTSGGTGTGDGSAPVDGAKSGGPNAGTYLVAFGEDALSSHANRANRVLAENCDFLDDLLHLPLPYVTFDAVAGSVSSHALTGIQTYVGPNGMANNQTNRDKLFKITDDQDREVEVGGTPVTVSLVHDGASSNVIGTEADGFYSGPTVNFSATLPSGSYRLYYGAHSNFADHALTRTEQSHEERIFARNSIAELKKLFASGLDERYRRSTHLPSSYNLDTAGDGAVIERDGAAPASREQDAALVTQFYSDPFMALWKAELNPAAYVSSPGTAKGGSTGFLGEVRTFPPGTQLVRDSGAYGAFVAKAPQNLPNGTVTAAQLRTKVDPTLNATLNPDALSTTTAKQTVELNASDYFRNTSTTAIAARHDLLLVTYPSGAQEAFVIDALHASNDRRATLMTLTGQPADFGSSSITVKAQWVQVPFSVRSYISYMGPQSFGLKVHSPANNCMDPDEITQSAAAGFFAATVLDHLGTNGSAYSWQNRNHPCVALAWGGREHDNDGEIKGKGFLLGDGSVEAWGGRLYGVNNPNPWNDNGASKSLDSATGTHAITWGATIPQDYSGASSDELFGGAIYLKVTGTGSTTVTVTMDSNYSPQEGDELLVYVYNEDGADVTMTWTLSAGGAKFANAQDAKPSITAEDLTVYKFRVFYNPKDSAYQYVCESCTVVPT